MSQPMPPQPTKQASSAAFRSAAAKAKIPIKGDKSRNPNQVQK